ncbi:Peptidase-S9 domain-containing protein [Aphelenchoides besseyi]|nr:Peptidase-S9 domain-containing protein [Aphelenchoides besseyi]
MGDFKTSPSAVPPIAVPSNTPTLPVDITQRSQIPALDPVTDRTQLETDQLVGPAPSNSIASPLLAQQTQVDIDELSEKTGRGFEVRGAIAQRMSDSDDEIFNASSPKTARKMKEPQVVSRHKFFPRSIFASVTPEAPKEISATKSQKKRRHTRFCRAMNRYKFMPSDPVPSTRYHKNDKRFLRKVDEYKVKKMIMECKCAERRCPWFDDCTYRLARAFRFLCRLVYLVCCPPFPPSFFHKLAFWPPPREYFFFINEDKTKRKAEAVQTATLKIRRASREAMNSNNNCYRFGFEHECFSEIEGVECFIVRTKFDNYLACAFIKPANPNPRYTLIFSHPNGSDISDHLSDTAAFLNCNIVAYDYSGYGISSGRHNERNLYADIEAVYQHTRTERNIPDESIILWGSSIGTAATVDLAVQLESIAGVILFAPPTSIVRALCWKRFCFCCRKRQPCRSPDWKCRMDKFNTIKKIRHVQSPLLIIHGKDDDIIPIEHGEALHIASKTKVLPLWIDGVGHNNIENSSQLWKRVRYFIRWQVEARPPAVKTAIERGEMKEIVIPEKLSKLKKRKTADTESPKMSVRSNRWRKRAETSGTQSRGPFSSNAATTEFSMADLNEPKLNRNTKK